MESILNTKECWHILNRFYIVTKLILPYVNDLMFSVINFNEKCEYLQEEKGWTIETKQYIHDLIKYCSKISPFIHYYKDQISSFNHTAHNILTDEISIILPQFPKVRKEKRGIITSLISWF